jgi:hypothetical protein
VALGNVGPNSHRRAPRGLKAYWLVKTPNVIESTVNSAPDRGRLCVDVCWAVETRNRPGTACLEMNRVGMSKRSRLPAPSIAQLEMLRAARDTGFPFSAGFSGGRVNAFRALCRARYLDPETGAITDAGRAALTSLEARLIEAAELLRTAPPGRAPQH